MTKAELEVEREYRYIERLALLGAPLIPTPQQDAIADSEALKAILELSRPVLTPKKISKPVDAK